MGSEQRVPPERLAEFIRRREMRGGLGSLGGKNARASAICHAVALDLRDARAALHASERHRAMWEANANEWRHKLAESERTVAALGAALTEYAIEPQEMSYHGEEIHCLICGATGTRAGYKRGVGDSPVEHFPACILASSGPAAAEWERATKQRERGRIAAFLKEHNATIAEYAKDEWAAVSLCEFLVAALAGPPAPSASQETPR